MPIHNTDIAEIFNKIADLLGNRGSQSVPHSCLSHCGSDIAESPRSAVESLPLS